MTANIDSKRIDELFQNLDGLRNLAWSLPLEDVAALSERVRFELIIHKGYQSSIKHMYRAYSDYLDDVVEERAEKEGKPHDSFHEHVMNYIRAMLTPENR